MDRGDVQKEEVMDSLSVIFFDRLLLIRFAEANLIFRNLVGKFLLAYQGALLLRGPGFLLFPVFLRFLLLNLFSFLTYDL